MASTALRVGQHGGLVDVLTESTGVLQELARGDPVGSWKVGQVAVDAGVEVDARLPRRVAARRPRRRSSWRSRCSRPRQDRRARWPGRRSCVPAATSVIVPSRSSSAMRAPTNSPAAWCESRTPLSSARRAPSTSDVVGGAALVVGAELTGGAELAELAELVGGVVVAGVAVSSPEEHAVTPSTRPAATVATAKATRRRTTGGDEVGLSMPRSCVARPRGGVGLGFRSCAGARYCGGTTRG